MPNLSFSKTFITAAGKERLIYKKSTISISLLPSGGRGKRVLCFGNCASLTLPATSNFLAKVLIDSLLPSFLLSFLPSFPPPPLPLPLPRCFLCHVFVQSRPHRKRRSLSLSLSLLNASAVMALSLARSFDNNTTAATDDHSIRH